MALANYLEMMKTQEVVALLGLGWSFRRIARETGVDRETVSRYARLAGSNPAKVFPSSEGSATGETADSGDQADPNAAKVFPAPAASPAKVFAGSHAPPRSVAKPFHDAIVEKLESGLTVQRIFQDLQEEYGYGHSYESVRGMCGSSTGRVASWV